MVPNLSKLFNQKVHQGYSYGHGLDKVFYLKTLLNQCKGFHMIQSNCLLNYGPGSLHSYSVMVPTWKGGEQLDSFVERKSKAVTAIHNSRSQVSTMIVRNFRTTHLL